MPLGAGVRLGPYEITSPLGAGGMGEVYRARDTRLERTVAIKVLPAHLAASPERRNRFEREAKAISALNHPHICVLYDIGHQDGIDFLVMEYLEGETLADRLKKGALPLDLVLRYGNEIAEALDKAHRQGIVHRDLKPGNVMVTKSGAKLLDFGLAKLLASATPAPAGSELSAMPTGDKPLTAEGSIMGTFQYMAPEQLEAREPDARTDIFAFGAMLHEMATGERAFQGKSQANLIGAILKDQPAPISSIHPRTPPALDRVVATCLAKDPDERWQNAHDLAAELKWIAAGPLEPVSMLSLRRRGRERWAWGTVAVLGMLLVGAMVVVAAHLREKPPLQVRFQVHPPENTTLGRAMALSPDGERIAFSAREDGFGISHLYVRALNLLTTTRVPGTEDGFEPFWSPDGRQLAFASRGTLKKLDLSGGSPQALCRIGDFVSGASWGRDGVIVFSAGGELFRVAATGGEPQRLGKRTEGETARTSPHFLPDGRYLYFSQTVRPENRGIFVASLASADGKRILPSDGAAVYSPSGHLLFVRGEALMAQAFDVDQLKLSGEPLRVGAQVALYGVSLQATQYGGTAAAAAYTVSRNGVLAWQADSGLGGMQLTWFDRRGKNLGTVGERAAYSNPALSPDERTLAISRVDPGTTTRDVWAYDLVRGTSTRLTFDPADDINPAWSPDGSRVAFTSDRKGVRQIYQKLANGAGDEELLLESTDWWKNVEHWSPDGRFLLYNYYRGGGPADLLLLPLGEGTERKPIPFLATETSEIMGQFAPSGGWIAYVSNESGRPEVYVRAVATDGSSPGGKWQVSTAGGLDPKWRGDQRELFYLSSSTVMAVDVKTEGMRFEAGIPHPLFEVRLPTAPRRNRYVVTRDGQRFLVTAVGDETPSPIDVLVNWLPSKR